MNPLSLPRSGLAVEPTDADWPSAWPESPARIAPEFAVVAVDRNRHRFKSDLDFRIVRLMAEFYPWPFPSLQTLAERLGIGIPKLRRRLAYLKRHALLSGFYSPPSAVGAKDGRTLRLINLPGLHEEMVLCHLCEGCGKPLEPGADRRKRVHDDRCRKRRDRAAQRASINPRPQLEGVRENPTSRPGKPDKQEVKEETEEIPVPF